MKLSGLIFALLLVGTLGQRGGGGRGGGGRGGGGGGNGRGGGRGNGGGNGNNGGGRGDGNGGGRGDGNNNNSDEDDNVPPQVSNFNTASNQVINAATYEMVVQVTDDVRVDRVVFEVDPPNGGAQQFQATPTGGGADTYTAQIFFDVDGPYSARVLARDGGNNMVSFPAAPVSFTVTGANAQPTTQAEIQALLDVRIRQAIQNNRRIAATFVRLGFHDCVPKGDDSDPALAGCDGCVNLATNPENNGLAPALQALAPIVASLESDTLGVSRADIWAYAALVGAEVSQNELSFTDNFEFGRTTCEVRGTCTDGSNCAENGPDTAADFPSPNLDTHALMTFFDEHFGFTMDQTVAIMGVHTLGRAQRGNSGFDGEWVNDEFDLDNEYYRQIVGSDNGNNGLNTNQEVLANGPNWRFDDINNNGRLDDAGRPIPDRFVWERGNLIMLNVDIAIVRDFSQHIEPDGDVSCSFRNNNQGRCPLADTLTRAGIYRDNNGVWLEDFREAFQLMLESGRGL